MYTVFCWHACLHARRGSLISLQMVICGSWDLNSGPLEEQPVLLTSEPFLQTDFELRVSCLASRVARITGVSHQAWHQPDFIHGRLELRQDLGSSIYLGRFKHPCGTKCHPQGPPESSNCSDQRYSQRVSLLCPAADQGAPWALSTHFT